MNIRPASFRDLARIEELYAAAGADDERHLQAQEHPVPQATLLRVWYAVSKTVSSLVPFTAGGAGDTLFVAESGREGIVGFIRAQAAAQGKSDAMQILNLCVTPTASGHFAREQLLTHLTNHGAEHGVHRFLVRLPVDDPLVSLFVERGFVQLATEQILYSDDASGDATAAEPLRPARREDIGAIYLLYLRTTPSRVASLEGPSLKSWQSGFADGALGRLGRDDVRHLLLEDPGVAGWASIRPASATRPTLLSLMCDGHDPRLREALVGGALRELPPGPVSSVLRHYDSELIRCLQKRGFAIYGTQVLLVRDLASRVRLRTAPSRRKPVLIRANLAHSVPVETPPLIVLSRGSDPSPHR